jgi:hypothetical protein
MNPPKESLPIHLWQIPNTLKELSCTLLRGTNIHCILKMLYTEEVRGHFHPSSVLPPPSINVYLLSIYAAVLAIIASTILVVNWTNSYIFILNSLVLEQYCVTSIVTFLGGLDAASYF